MAFLFLYDFFPIAEGVDRRRAFQLLIDAEFLLGLRDLLIILPPFLLGFRRLLVHPILW